MVFWECLLLCSSFSSRTLGRLINVYWVLRSCKVLFKCYVFLWVGTHSVSTSTWGCVCVNLCIALELVVVSSILGYLIPCSAPSGCLWRFYGPADGQRLLTLWSTMLKMGQEFSIGIREGQWLLVLLWLILVPGAGQKMYRYPLWFIPCIGSFELLSSSSSNLFNVKIIRSRAKKGAWARFPMRSKCRLWFVLESWNHFGWKAPQDHQIQL